MFFLGWNFFFHPKFLTRKIGGESAVRYIKFQFKSYLIKIKLQFNMYTYEIYFSKSVKCCCFVFQKTSLFSSGPGEHNKISGHSLSATGAGSPNSLHNWMTGHVVHDGTFQQWSEVEVSQKFDSYLPRKTYLKRFFTFLFINFITVS